MSGTGSHWKKDLNLEAVYSKNLRKTLSQLKNEKRKMHLLLDATIQVIAKTKSEIILYKYILKLSNKNDSKNQIRDLQMQESKLLMKYKRLLQKLIVIRKKYNNVVREVTENLVPSNHGIFSNDALVIKYISLASMQKNLTTLAAKLAIVRNSKQISNLRGGNGEALDSKIQKIKFAIQTAQNKSDRLTKEIAFYDIHDNNIMQEKHAKILSNASAYSLHIVRISRAVDAAAFRTINFSAPIFGATATEGSKCDAIPSVSCGSSCCPDQFPTCGGTDNCPAGKCCSKLSGPVNLRSEYVNVSAIYGIDLIQPVLSYKNMSREAYMNKIYSMTHALRQAREKLVKAKEENMMMQTENAKIIVNVSWTFKRENKGLQQYKNASNIYERRISNDLKVLKHEYNRTLNIVPKIVAALSRHDKNASQLTQQFFQLKIEAKERLDKLANIAKKNNHIKAIIGKIEFVGKRHYIDDLTKVVQNVIRNGKEIENALESISNNYKMLQELQLDANKWYDEAKNNLIN